MGVITWNVCGSCECVYCDTCDFRFCDYCLSLYKKNLQNYIDEKELKEFFEEQFGDDYLLCKTCVLTRIEKLSKIHFYFNYCPILNQFPLIRILI